MASACPWSRTPIHKRTCHITVVVSRYTEEELERMAAQDALRERTGASARAAVSRRERVEKSRAAETAREAEHDHEHEHDDGHDDGHDHEAVEVEDATEEAVEVEDATEEAVEVEDATEEAVEVEDATEEADDGPDDDSAEERA